MAFHISCPITCRKICDCALGFADGLHGGAAREAFMAEVAGVEDFLRDPWTVRADSSAGTVATVHVLVPRVVLQTQALPAEEVRRGDREKALAAVARRDAMQQQAKAAEDYVRMLETGQATETLGELVNNVAEDDQGSSVSKVICRICFSGENDGSQRAAKMVSCTMCSKKYHRSCLKVWGEYRDLFHWSSWSCPSCRICEVCRRGGDPSKLMFCKRCDAAYHCYCQQPPHKNVTHGPYLCPKHTKCHSCGSTVPGNGLSTRWFLGYTCCDACGRLFVKGNYCPVCLKVYRDSESTPMVCCDVCQQWVHCICDGISDEKYQEFQTDGNLYYKCAACRGDCYQVKDINDAVKELWRRRDKADGDLIDSLRIVAGLPLHEAFSISPYSDDEDATPVTLKSDQRKTIRFSVKSSMDKSTKIIKEHGKNASKNSSAKKKFSKKGSQVQLIREHDVATLNGDNQEAGSMGSTFSGEKKDSTYLPRINRSEVSSSNGIRIPGEDVVKIFNNQLGSNNSGIAKHDLVNLNQISEVKASGTQKILVKEDNGKKTNEIESGKGKKLVIHIGGKNRKNAFSPKSESTEPSAAVSDGNKSAGQQEIKDREEHSVRMLDRFSRHEGERGANANTTRVKISMPEDREDDVIKLVKASNSNKKGSSRTVRQDELVNAREYSTFSPPKDMEDDEEPTFYEDHSGNLHSAGPEDVSPGDCDMPQVSKPGDLKPLLKLKFKAPYLEQQERSSWASHGAEDKNKGQRSKRKRPSLEKLGTFEDDSRAQRHLVNQIDELMDAKILQKLGKDAIGKRVEVHQPSSGTWHKGVVHSYSRRNSSLSVRLDDGRTKNVELGKQAVRFVSQEKKRAKRG